MRTIPIYLRDVMSAVVGKKDHLNFHARLIEREQLDNATEAQLVAFFDGPTGPFSPYLIYVPFINLIYIVRFFVPGKSPYVLAIGQGMVLTILVAVAAYFYGFFDPILTIALLPIAL